MSESKYSGMTRLERATMKALDRQSRALATIAGACLGILIVTFAFGVAYFFTHAP